MSLVLGVGVGTFLFLFFLAILIIILIIGHNSKLGQAIFWGLLIVFIIAFVLLAVSPTEADPKEEDIVDKYYILIIFSIFILLGFIIAIVAYLLVVLLHQDYAVTIPS
ncbi:hypothetical protein TVAGG3_0560980 [Trichomonas vaginalis G3]|uniref:hypothetical protein n=1 Tax=Trichomonas vaginalis (strain ATCC PRA-98 / G3) TaxID=412133 RepID=UPI0021E5E072|nr:hypothetical protein TVAGG3_0560980 [Trichomonas vaginalis G3]KAI5521186.1 hypothetical protein TVAGG3_0560980 [Trichomonas vaginalis G3]